MSKKLLGVGVPLFATALTLAIVFVVGPKPSIQWGIVVGLLLALIQSFFSVGSMSWAWKKNYFYWVWGGGIFFRILVFGGTAFVVYRYTHLSLVATLISMVTATTLFLVLETVAFLEKT